MVRTTKGRQKVAMAKMTSESNLQVTFSKRRAGLFKKASELCTLCGAEIAIIVFSPGKKAFSFGHPSVESVVDRFLNRMPAPLPARPPAAATDSAAGTMRLIEAHRNASVRELNVQLAQLEAQLEAEKKRGEALGQMRQAGPGVGLGQRWWEAPVGELGLPQLEQLKGALEELKGNAAKQVDQLLIEAANPTAAAVAPPFFGGNSGGVGPAYESKSAVFGSGGPMNGMMLPPPQAYNFGYGHGYF